MLNQTLILGLNDVGVNFALIDNRYFYYTPSSQNEIGSQNNFVNVLSEISYTNWVGSSSFQSSVGNIANKPCDLTNYEVLFYEKKGQNLNFYFILEGTEYEVLFGEIDKEVSCKLVKDIIVICTYTEISQVKLKFLVYKDLSGNGDKLMETFNTFDVEDFNNHKHAILYDTSNKEYKILCAVKKNDNTINCIIVHIQASYYYNSHSFNVDFQEISDFQAGFSYNENNCNLTKYGSEYIICCGKEGGIICDRRYPNLTLIDSFSLNIEGKISNLTMDINEDYLKLIYVNEI